MNASVYGFQQGGITDSGDSIFYDVVSMKPATFEIKKEKSPTGVTTQKAIDTAHEDSSENTISQDAVSVNRNFSENANKYQDRDPDEAIRYSDRTFSYDELVNKGNIRGTVIKNDIKVPLKKDGSIDGQSIVSKVRNLCFEIQTNSSSPTYFIRVPDISSNVRIIEKSITHGFFDSTRKNKKPSARDLINAKVSLAIPEILSNSIEVNRSYREGNRDILYSHIMIGTVGIENDAGSTEYYAVRSVIEERTNLDSMLVEAEILGKLHAVNAKKIDSSNLKTAEKSTVRGHGEVYFSYSIAHLLEDVKGVFDDTFSEDVYNRLSAKRKENDFSLNLLYQDRDPDASYTNRSLLLNALKPRLPALTCRIP